MAKSNTKPQSSTSSCSKCSAIHFNNLWSVWYGALGGTFQICVALKCIKRLLNYSILTWPDNLPLPTYDMNTSLALTGAGILLIPLFVVTAVFKVGNLANDGYKLGRHLSACSRETPREVFGVTNTCSFWKFGGPSAPFIHGVIAFCLLLPKLLMEARLIEANFYPPEMTWHTDLDFLTEHKDRLVILSFMTLATNDSIRSYTKAPTELLTTTSHENIITDTSSNHGPLTLANTVVNILKQYIGTDDGSFNVVDYEHGNYVSLEYINFALALGIYAVRYASLFWATNKSLSILFSVQLIFNGVQILLSYAGVSVLYKVQVMDAIKVLPFFKHIGKSSQSYRSTQFLLNPMVSIMLYILYILLIVCSSLVFYLYGHIRFKNFLNQNCQRKVILLKEQTTSRWTYFTHCTALCLIIAMGVCSSPLFYDYTIVYRGSLDPTVLICIIGGILHLFLWIVLWLFLTIKQNWVFKLRITIGKTPVKQSSSIKLAADVFSSTRKYDDNFDQPLLVASNGYIYSVTENSTKSDIVNILQKDINKSKGRSEDTLCSDDNSDNQIYWLKSELFDSRNSHFKYSKDKSPNETKTGHVCVHDDGDYATLKKPEAVTDSDDGISEVDKLLSNVHAMDISYANTGQDLIPVEECKKETSPLLPSASVSNPVESETPAEVIIHETAQFQKIQNRYKRVTVHDEIPTRYDTISMGSSTSPPDNPDSETSSGVHSNESTDHLLYTNTQQNVACQETKLQKIVENDGVIKERVRWKSCSLHRCVRSDGTESAQATNKYYSLNPSISSVHDQFNNKSVCPHSINQSTNSSENTLVICRKLQPFKINDKDCYSSGVDNQFGRSTNMRMSSFTEHNFFKNAHNAYVTLPYCIPPHTNKNIYTHCTTMPLLPENSSLSNQSQNNHAYLRHSTIPSHHNGVELYNNKGHQYK